MLRKLRAAGFTADYAYPGCRFGGITETVAAVHLCQVDRGAMTVTVEVFVISPAELGGAACELAALRATEALHWSKASCVQEGCRYDSVARVYSVRILATYTCLTWEDDFRMGPGFRVYAEENSMPYAVRFRAEREQTAVPRYEMGETGPVDIDLGPWVWKLTIEELIPPGMQETYAAKDAVKIRVVTDNGAEVYFRCRWTEETREFTKQGLRRISTCLSPQREEVPIGETAV